MYNVNSCLALGKVLPLILKKSFKIPSSNQESLKTLRLVNNLGIGMKRGLLFEAEVYKPLMSHCYMGFCVCKFEGALKRDCSNQIYEKL